MLQSKSFLKKTKRGTLLKVVREHYLRDDIACGSLACSACDRSKAVLSAQPQRLLVIDTNVALHQIDLLEQAAISDVVVLSVVREEVRNRNLSVYNRLLALCGNTSRRFFVFANENHRDTFVKAVPGETPNDRNDRAIRTATSWYQRHLGEAVRVLLLSDDRGNLERAREEKVEAMSVREFVKSLGQPELEDLVARGDAPEEGEGEEDAEDQRPGKRQLIYPEHKPFSEIRSGLSSGRLLQGKLRVSAYNPFEAYVGSEALGHQVLVHGRADLNRALEGDTVALELLPEEEWREAAGAVEMRDADADADDEEAEDEVRLPPAAADAPPETPAAPVDGASAGQPRRPTGRVVGIIKREPRQVPGSLDARRLPGGVGGKARVLFKARDRRLPWVRLTTRQLGNLAGKRIVVQIDGWERTSRFPHGHYVRTLGDIGDRATETEVLILENNIDTRPFSAQVLACLPPLPWQFPREEEERAERRDLRDLEVVSVDPVGCRDIDDALHCSPLPNGNLAVGVHIADVTHFVLPSTPIDAEAAARGTSTYLVERRIDMLPKPLTEDICSLREGVDRLAFSVLWEMTPSADILDVRFTKSIIRSRRAFSYLEAQALMDDPRAEDSVTHSLRSLNRLAKQLRARRMERGALTLASPEVKFEIDTETQNPLDVGMYQIRESNQMIEEFMLLANISVAEKILKHFPTFALLRRHPTPTPKMLEPLLAVAASVGVSLDVSSSKALAESLDAALGPQGDDYFNKLIRILATRCMTQAVYFSSGELSPPEYHHYGLASPLYTHFTSPIRRYADVVVHRLLAAALGLAPVPPEYRSKAALTGIADNLNYRHRNAQMAGRASVELHTLIFFRTRPTDTEARIVRVRPNGIIVFVPKFGIEGPVYLAPKKAREGGRTAAAAAAESTGVFESGLSASVAALRFRMDEAEQTVSSEDGSVRLRVLDRVKVHIQVVEPEPNRPKLSLTLVL